MAPQLPWIVVIGLALVALVWRVWARRWVAPTSPASAGDAAAAIHAAPEPALLQTPIPSEFLAMAPYLATIVVVAGLIGKARPPAADGQPYVKE